MQRSTRLATGILLVASLFVAVSAAAAAPPSGTVVQFVSLHNGKCLTLLDSSTANGAKAVQRPCSTSTSQQWRLVASAGDYQLVNVASGRCLAAPAAGGVVQADCGAPAGADQLFTLAEAAGGIQVKPRSATPQRCLEIPGGTAADSAPLTQSGCGSGSAQRWTARPTTQLLANAGFEGGATGWQLSSTGAGTATNYPHGGSRLAYLDQTASAFVKQSVTVAAGGSYEASAWVATSGSTGRLAVRRNGTEIGVVRLPKETRYQRYVVGGLTVAAGDSVEVAVLSATDGWVNVDDVALQADTARLRIASSNAKLLDLFNWSAANAGTWVQPDGKVGAINSGNGTYKASYWAGYDSRPAYYSRDTAHQIVGAHLLGLGQETKNMLRSFASSATAARGHYPLWAIAFDTATPYSVDYRNDNDFVREVPAVFELVEASDRAYAWSGDPDYVTDGALWTYYLNALNAFVTGHNARIPNGSVAVAEGVSTDIFKGTASYNEQGSEGLIEAGDAIASQYRAYLGLADLAVGRGDTATAATYRTRAQDLRAYFNTTWSVKPGSSDLVRGYSVTSGRANPLTGWGKENSIFMPMKRIVDPGARLDAYLTYIDARDTDPTTRSGNIESYTYLPDTYFPYNRNDTAWKWMQYVYERRIHYPELSFTLVGQVVQGLLGVEPDARTNTVATQPHLASDIGWLSADNVSVGSNQVAVRHDGARSSVLTNTAGAATLTWEARFVGGRDSLLVNGSPTAATIATINGVTVSYVRIPVPPGAAVTVSAP